MIAILFTCSSGLILLYLGAITLNGQYKRWYLGPRIFPPQAVVYAAIPFGLGLIVLSVVVFFPTLNDGILGWVVVGLIFLTGYILAIWRPRWIKPHWVRWLEENYWDRIHILIADARRNPRHWEERVATQEGLEEWALQVAGEPRHRHKED